MPAKQRIAWHEGLASFANDPDSILWAPPQTIARASIWLKRFEFYTDIDGKPFKRLRNWKKKRKLYRAGVKLLKALDALREITANVNTIDEDDYNEMYNATIQVIFMHLLKLELAQQSMLEKAHGLERDLKNIPLSHIHATIRQLRRETRKSISARPTQLSKTAKKSQLHNTARFFRSRERFVNYTRAYNTTDRVSEGFALVNAINNLIHRISTVVATLANAIARAGSNTLQAIPFISSFLNAIPVVVHAARVWAKNKSNRKKLFASILLAVVAGGIVTTGFGTIAAASVAISLMVIGLTVKHIHPWVEFLVKIRKKQNEAKEIDAILAGKKPLPFGFRERQMLLIKLEEMWIQDKNSNKNKDKYTELKNLILHADRRAIVADPNVQKFIGSASDLDAFITIRLINHRKALTTQIDALRQQERRKRAYVFNGVFAIMGAILICIPTPVTMILGASILTVTAVITLGISFNWWKNIYAWGKRQASRGKNSELVELPEHDPSFVPKQHPQSVAQINGKLHTSPNSNQADAPMVSLEGSPKAATSSTKKLRHRAVLIGSPSNQAPTQPTTKIPAAQLKKRQ